MTFEKHFFDGIKFGLIIGAFAGAIVGLVGIAYGYGPIAVILGVIIGAIIGAISGAFIGGFVISYMDETHLDPDSFPAFEVFGDASESVKEEIHQALSPLMEKYPDIGISIFTFHKD